MREDSCTDATGGGTRKAVVSVSQSDGHRSQQESGSDAAAKPETDTETTKKAQSGRGRRSEAGDDLLVHWLGLPAASGPVRMLWFVV